MADRGRGDGAIVVRSIRTAMATNPNRARPRDLADRLFRNPFFTVPWIAVLIVILRFVSWPVRDFALVCWVYGSDAYFHGGIRVVRQKPTTFSNGELAPGLPDFVTGALAFGVTAFGLSLMLILVLRCYERMSKRGSSRSGVGSRRRI